MVAEVAVPRGLTCTSGPTAPNAVHSGPGAPMSRKAGTAAGNPYPVSPRAFLGVNSGPGPDGLYPPFTRYGLVLVDEFSHLVEPEPDSSPRRRS